MRLVAGEVNKEIFDKFEKMRKELREKGGSYGYYFKTKSDTIRLFIEVFLSENKEFMKIVKKVEEKNAPDD